jgi:hypothetical protein
MNNGQSKDIYSIGHTKHKTMGKKNTTQKTKKMSSRDSIKNPEV